MTRVAVVVNNSNTPYFAGLNPDKRAPEAVMMGDDNLAVSQEPVEPGDYLLWTHRMVGWNEKRTGHKATSLASMSVQQR